MSRSNLSSRRRGGAKRKPDRAQPQEKFGGIFRPEVFRRTDHPVCSASEASRLFIDAAATPPFQGGETTRRAAACCFGHYSGTAAGPARSCLGWCVRRASIPVSAPSGVVQVHEVRRRQWPCGPSGTFGFPLL